MLLLDAQANTKPQFYKSDSKTSCGQEQRSGSVPAGLGK